MKLFLFQAVAGVLLVTIVAAVFFRSGRAWDLLHVIRRVGWAYVIVIVILAVFRLWQKGAG